MLFSERSYPRVVAVNHQALTEATADHRCTPRDSVDRLLADWQRVRPDLDVSPVGVVTRLERVRGHIEAEIDRLFADFHLGGPSFAVLVTLARLNEPGGVSQRRLMEELGLTSGTISVRMDRLVENGLVERLPDADDKRNTRITLTPRGQTLFERITPAHLDNERRLLAALSEPEQQLLADLLRKLLVEFEGSLPPPEAPLRLGMTVAPAYVTIAMRHAVGLPAAIGLLVRAVDDGGPAATADLRQGDVLMRAGRYALRSAAALYAAIADAAASRRLRIHVLRGTEEVALTVELAHVTTAPLAPATTGGRTAHEEHSV